MGSKSNIWDNIIAPSGGEGLDNGHRNECRRMIEQYLPGVRTAEGRVSADGAKVIKASRGGFYVFGALREDDPHRSVRVHVVVDDGRVSIEAAGLNAFEVDLRIDDPPDAEALKERARSEAALYLRRAQLF